MLFQKSIIEEMRNYLGSISDFPNLGNRISETTNRQAGIFQELFHT
jgi:hypothetical protein